MGQFRHIVCLVKLGRVDLVDLIGIHFPLLYMRSVLLEGRAKVETAPTSPSSVWTSSRPPSKSSNTSPRTNAFSASRNHTYLFPEKSLSPSSPRIWSAPRRSSSDLIKLGANVPDDSLLRTEFDRWRLMDAGDRLGVSCETDAFRRCPLADSNPCDGLMIADLGRGCDCGAGDGDERPNGLARLGELLS